MFDGYLPANTIKKTKNYAVPASMQSMASAHTGLF